MLDNTVRKLTAVNVSIRGKKTSTFVMCPYVDDKPQISLAMLHQILRETAGTSLYRGETYSIG